MSATGYIYYYFSVFMSTKAYFILPLSFFVSVKHSHIFKWPHGSSGTLMPVEKCICLGLNNPIALKGSMMKTLDQLKVFFFLLVYYFYIEIVVINIL